jgi:predicted RNase H-like nuclease
MRAEFRSVELGSQPDFLLEAEAVGIDIPLTFQDGPRRACDVQARRLAPASTVFNAPARAVVERYEEDPLLGYRELTDLNRRYQVGARGQPLGLSKQAFGLLPYIADARRIAARLGSRVLEVHPEVSFALLTGRRLAPKRTPQGRKERRELLASLGVEGLPDRVSHHCLDAAVAAFTAFLVTEGEFLMLGEESCPLYAPRRPRYD